MVTMLIVDDESVIREGLRDMIDWASIGVSVVGLAADGIEGLKLAESITPDIVLSDVIIPGMDGIAFCRRLHEIRPETRIIMISAYHNADYIRAAFKYDALDYILKPFDNDEMLRIVKKAADQVTERRRQKLELAAMEEQIRHSRPAMRQQFLSNLIAGRAGNADEIARQMELLGLDYSVGESVCALQIWLDPAADLDERTADAAFESALAALFAARPEQCMLYRTDAGRCVALLKLVEGGMAVESLACETRDALNTQGLQATIGIGTAVESPGDAGLSCSQAETACNYRLLLGRNQIIAYSEISALAAGDLPPQLKRARDGIIDSVVAGNTAEAIDMLHGLFTMLRQGGVADEYLIRSVCIDQFSGISYAMDGDAGDGRKIRQFIKALKPMRFIDDMEWLMEESVTSYAKVLKTVSTGEASQAVRRLKEVVAERYMERLTLSSLAKEVYLTPNYVAALFKKETAQTLNDFITGVRIEKAKALLKNRDSSIQDVSEAVGYQDVSYFAHLFKKHTGVTPAEYHRKSR